MIRIAVAALIASAMFMSCSKTSDIVAPVTESESQSQRVAATAVTINKRIDLPISGTSVYITDASTIKYLPGDTLVVPRNVVRVTLYKVAGTAEKPVVITAAPGVIIGGFDRASFDIVGKYIKLVDMNINGKPTAIGIKAYYCSDISIENVHIDGAGIGIMLKNDAIATDPNTYYPNAVIRNVVLRNCSVKNCANEGYYIGNTSDYQNGYKNSPIIGLTVQNCSAENTGWDGFQVTNAQNCLVDGVSVTNAGTANKEAQMSGITIQDATTGTFQNLTVNTSTAAGLNLFSCGEVHVKNVALKDVALSSKSYGIIVDNRYDRGFNLGAKKLFMENVSVKQTTSIKGKIAMYVINGSTNGAVTAIPGTVTNFTYDVASWEKKTVDYAKNIYYGGTDGTPITTPAASETPQVLALPFAPANVTAAAAGTTVNLAWSAPSNTGGGAITAYKIYRGTVAGKYNLIRTNSGGTLYYADGNKVAGTTYYYAISAVNSVGEGTLSAAVKVTP